MFGSVINLVHFLKKHHALLELFRICLQDCYISASASDLKDTLGRYGFTRFSVEGSELLDFPTFYNISHDYLLLVKMKQLDFDFFGNSEAG